MFYYKANMNRILDQENVKTYNENSVEFFISCSCRFGACFLYLSLTIVDTNKPELSLSLNVLDKIKNRRV